MRPVHRRYDRARPRKISWRENGEVLCFGLPTFATKPVSTVTIKGEPTDSKSCFYEIGLGYKARSTDGGRLRVFPEAPLRHSNQRVPGRSAQQFNCRRTVALAPYGAGPPKVVPVAPQISPKHSFSCRSMSRRYPSTGSEGSVCARQICSESLPSPFLDTG